MEQDKIKIVNHFNLFPSQDWLDERTFEAIFSENYAHIYAVIFRLVGDQDEADDLAAETFWRLWKRPPAKDENVAGWLYRVATHLGYNALRSSRRRSVHETEAGHSLFESRAEANPEQEVLKRSERERVRAIFRQMSLRDVQILVLRYSGLTYKEIALATHTPASSIGTLLSRAEEKFERLYSIGDSNAPER